MPANILWFEEIDLNHIGQVGGKNASLGEMIKHLNKAGVQVPRGFATTADAYYHFLTENKLDQKIAQAIETLDINDITALTATGKQIREWILAASFSQQFINEISKAFHLLQEQEDFAVAIRSSATAEDLPDASFAGQQETFLNVCGIDNVLIAIKKVFASLFNDRAITYRAHHHYDHLKIALSAGIQRMVRSDLASSGVAFSIDTESGFDEVIFITSSYGLGEPIVQGAVNPDEFYVYKPNLKQNRPAIVRRHLGSKAIKMIYGDQKTEHTVATINVDEKAQQQFSLNDDEILFLAQQTFLIEQHYGRPMDVEWAKDGVDGKIYIVQARPETVKSRSNLQTMERYQLNQRSNIKAEGRSVGSKIGQGTGRVILDLKDMDRMKKGDVLVTDMTDPDWEPIMKRASAIVTNRGGRTCHAAIVARELGIPAVVGCGNATQTIQENENITVSCADGETGYVYEGLLDFTVQNTAVEGSANLPFKIMLNIGNPEHAFAFRTLPNAGVGLARLEFMISQTIGVHPNALLNFHQLPNDLQNIIQRKMACYSSPVDFYVEKLCEGISTLACGFFPKPIIVRLSDFKSNEYANLLGGHLYEPAEENPMLGFRGASRYVADSFRQCFALECRALRKAREELGFTNVEVMIPFVRTLDEAKQAVELLAENGLRRGENGLRLIMMCEIPSNALLAEEFLEYFDGFSIGSNDLTQLTLGIDRDSGLVAKQFDERNPAVKFLLQRAITACKKLGKYIGICGQGPSDHPDFAQWLVEQGIESISLNPDSVLGTINHLSSKYF